MSPALGMPGADAQRAAGGVGGVGQAAAFDGPRSPPNKQSEQSTFLISSNNGVANDYELRGSGWHES